MEDNIKLIIFDLTLIIIESTHHVYRTPIGSETKQAQLYYCSLAFEDLIELRCPRVLAPAKFIVDPSQPSTFTSQVTI